MIYLSFDVETDGRSPAVNSMISLGVAAFIDGALHSTFKVNIQPRSGLPCDQATWNEFWSKWPKKWEACQVDAKPRVEAMKELFLWLDRLPGRNMVWVAGPASFDWQWVNFYHGLCCNDCANNHEIEWPYMAECLSTARSKFGKLTLGLAGPEYYAWNNALHGGHPNPDPHDALQDAIHQGWEWVNLLQQMREHSSTIRLQAA